MTALETLKIRLGIDTEDTGKDGLLAVLLDSAVSRGRAGSGAVGY